MRNIYLFLSTLFIFCFCSTAIAQQRSDIGCIDKATRVTAEGLKQSFVKQGMTVFKDAAISMQSETPFPIEVELKKQTEYQLIFVGNIDALSAKLTLYDGDDNKIGERKIKKSERTGYIIYSFIPEKTDVYLILLTQKLKNKTICSSFTIMQQPAKDNLKSSRVDADQPSANEDNNTQTSSSNKHKQHTKK